MAGKTFEDLMREIEEEAKREGPHAVAQLRAFEEYFKKQAEEEQERISHSSTNGDSK